MTTSRYTRNRYDGELADSTWFTVIFLLLFVLACTLCICWAHGEETKRVDSGCVVVEPVDKCVC